MRLLRGRVTELARAVWQARVSPRVVRLASPEGEDDGSGKKQQTDTKEIDEKKASMPVAAAPSPFQQYVAQRVRAVQMQQHASKLQQRIHLLADQQKRIFLPAGTAAV
jgi:hypothetical protein